MCVVLVLALRVCDSLPLLVVQCLLSDVVVSAVLCCVGVDYVLFYVCAMCYCYSCLTVIPCFCVNYVACYRCLIVACSVMFAVGLWCGVSVGLCVLYVLLYLVVDMCCSSLLMCDVLLLFLSVV